MKIGGLQKLTLLDFPGKAACIVFFEGCNFRCPYCHNSGLVVPECYEEELPEEELFRFLKKRQGLLDGVCITGGEPLLQKDIILFLEKIRELGYQIKLDTNGSFPKLLKEICGRGLLDYVAMDIKHSREKYHMAVGCRNFSITDVEESAAFLMEGTVPYEFRTTLVKGIHEPEDMNEIGAWIGGASPYYLQNFKDSGNVLGFMDGSAQLSPFTENELEEFKNRGLKYNMDVIVRNV